MSLTALRGARLVDGLGGEPIDDATVVMDGSVVVSVGTAPPPSDAEVVDAGGLVLTPGLIDAHAHVVLSSDWSAGRARALSLSELAANVFACVADALDAGFTTVRDVGGADAGLVRAIASGKVEGPRILCAAQPLYQTGGHSHFCSAWTAVQEWESFDLPGLCSIGGPVDGTDEVRKAAREAFRRGADFLKMCVTGGVTSFHDHLSDTQFQVDEVAAAVDEARARGTYVTVHAHNNEGIRNAVAGGALCVEHGTAIDDETAALMASHGVAFVPTLAVIHTLAESATTIGLPPEMAERARGVEADMGRAILAARAAGVRVGSGSDLIGPDQSYRGLELTLRAAVTDPMEALVAATRVNADILGIGEKVGSVEPGKVADLVGWSRDPLADPSAFHDRSAVALVVQSGRVVRGPR